MRKPPVIVGLALAVVASASTWFYFNKILRAQQLAYAAAHGQPRGNLSDLYPRWLGARELLLRRRNPYGADITGEIQQGYYGRALDPARADDPKDQQGFAYPVYVVFLLGPTVELPFSAVQLGFRWFLIALAAGSVWLWMRALRWRPACLGYAAFMVLAVGWLPMVQGIKLQQLSLLVAGLLAACAACLAGGWLFVAGGLLAVATIKPQIAWPIVGWLLLWGLSEWRSRWRLIAGFALVMGLSLAGAEVILPGWIPMFFDAIRRYHQYTQNQSMLVWLVGSIIARVLEMASVLASVLVLWRIRNAAADSAAFGRAFALVLALSVVVVPMFALYNQVLLMPAILMLVRNEISGERVLPAVRFAKKVGALLLAWPWVATILLSAGYLWITPELREKLWQLPLYATFLLPLFVFGVAILEMVLVSQEPQGGEPGVPVGR